MRSLHALALLAVIGTAPLAGQTNRLAPYLATPPDVVERMLTLARVGPGDVVYDLGCGDGRIVIAAAKAGARGVGVDIDPALLAKARLLAQAAKLLRPGGYFLATTLSGEGFDIQVLWEKSRSVFPPHHLNFLNPESLARLCREAGFLVKAVETPGLLDWQIVDGALQREEARADRFWETLSKRGTSESKQELQAWITKHGFSSHMRILAQKPLV